MRLSLHAVLAAALPLTIACSAPTDASTTWARVAGAWFDVNELNPSGYCFHFQLHVQGNVVTGSGQYCWQPATEVLAVSGTANGAVLTLTFTGDLGTVVTWKGTSFGDAKLIGRATWVSWRGQPDGATYDTQYVRN